MTGIGEALEHEWQHLRHPHASAEPSAAPVFTPATQSQQEAPVSVLSTLHQDLTNIGGAVEHAWPILNQVVTNPAVDELVEVALTAVGAGVEAAAFAAAIDALNGAIKRKAGTADQVASAVDAGQQAMQQGTGSQPAMAPRVI